MKLAIVGSRSLSFFDKSAIKNAVPPETKTILSGGAAGIDTLAEEIAAELGLRLEVLLPDYTACGKKAPLLRNDLLVARADRVLAVWDYRSRGTAYVIVKCIETGVPVQVIGPRSRAQQK